ncbi:cellulose biosynthesis protein BcsP [Paraburkholderia fungorum]|uniref:cellulose biosynthesis protein BcsP n=1 Tax=Paraburkholderia fungorum TaxID=134537 RepID=UPI000DB4B0DD|nr:cellulose biosynthesis protein BcsP [Paraburkholderia fungorum]PZR40937.1 MAG: hypothetical protein DI523_34215 [Paraburkholderia fungorum]
MSSSSDIEKLFDHFGGDANAYQEIGRENEARSARTRWPLLVTLDLTQPTIPAIRQRREADSETLAQEAARKAAEEAAAAADRQDDVPKDAASVTRAKAPLFTRSHRRDIPPVVVAAKSAAPSGASRFGALETNDGTAVSPGAETAPAAPTAPTAPVPPAVTRTDAAAPLARQAAPAVAPPSTSIPPVAAAPARAAVPPANIAPLGQFRTPALPVTQTMASMPLNLTAPRAPAPAWTQAPAPSAWAQTPAQAHAPTYPTAPAAPTPPASILGKLFATQAAPAPRQPAAGNPGESAPLQSVFDRLRGTPAQTAPAPAGTSRAATPGASNSWLVNGPRRS